MKALFFIVACKIYEFIACTFLKIHSLLGSHLFKIYDWVGPTLPKFLLLFAFNIVLVVEYSLTKDSRDAVSKKTLKHLAGLFPLFYVYTGVVGSFLGIIFSFTSLGRGDPNSMLAQLFVGMKHAMISSVVGVELACIALLTNTLLFKKEEDGDER